MNLENIQKQQDTEQELAGTSLDIRFMQEAMAKQATRVSRMENPVPDDMRIALKSVSQAAMKAESLRESVEAGMDLRQLMMDIGLDADDNLRQIQKMYNNGGRQ